MAGQFCHCLLIKRRLLTTQGAEGFHLGLVGQVGNDALIGLQPSQDIGAHQVAERTVRVMWPVSAMRISALSLLTDFVCLAAGFLMACASSSTTNRHDVVSSQGVRVRKP